MLRPRPHRIDRHGQTTTAAMFRAEGVPVHDAEPPSTALCRQGRATGGGPFPGVVTDGRVDRALLGQRVLGDGAAMKRLEAIVHPLVREAEEEFLQEAAKRSAVAVLDIPLLFETGGEARPTRSWW